MQWYRKHRMAVPNIRFGKEWTIHIWPVQQDHIQIVESCASYWVHAIYSCYIVHVWVRLKMLYCLSLSRFNGHFPGEPGLAGVYYLSKGWWRWRWTLDNWSYKSCKATVKSSPPTNQHPVFTGWMPFLLPNQQCQSTEGKSITFHGLAYPKLTWGSSNFDWQQVKNVHST